MAHALAVRLATARALLLLLISPTTGSPFPLPRHVARRVCRKAKAIENVKGFTAKRPLMFLIGFVGITSAAGGVMG